MNIRHLLLLAGSGAFALISCGDDQISGPTEGTIQIGAVTSGDDFDPNGYTFAINNGESDPIGLQDTVYVEALEAGDYAVQLAGLADNCTTPEGTNPQSTTVTAGDTVIVNFAITCELLGGPPGDGGGDL